MNRNQPIKYLDNNLVFNHDGECFAYYELVPYNYSFLSKEKKEQVHDTFRQLIAQNRDGKIHALQIATETSVRRIQEQCKKEAKGNLKEVAVSRIDIQTEALVENLGDYQIEYRFFLGFKLINSQDEMDVKKSLKKTISAIKDFIYGVNHEFMGDFVSMDNKDIEQYMRLEKLMCSRIFRRFNIRKLDKNDIGYLLEHLYGNSGVAYEDYEYPLCRKKIKKKTLIKKYDLVKPGRCRIEEKGRHLEITREDRKLYVAYLTINSIVGELEFPSTEFFYYLQEELEFPVDTSMNIEIITNKKALHVVRNKKKEVNDLENHAWQSGNDAGQNVIDAIEDVNELENELDVTKESMYKLSYVIRIAADDMEELKRRCDVVMNFYDDRNVKLVRPFGDMIGLQNEFILSSSRYMNDYIQYVTSDFLASLGFGAAQMLGDKNGIYIGYNRYTGERVYLNPRLAAQGMENSVTNALAVAILGALGGGKSMFFKLLLYYLTCHGSKSLILDPKCEYQDIGKHLPEITSEVNSINLTSEEKNKGLLDPYVIMKNVKDADSLATDILTFLVGITSRNADKFPVLRKAIRAVTKSETRGLLLVIEELKKEGTEIADNLAAHIESFVDYDFAQLLFSDGSVKQSISLEKQLNIISVADLVLPDKDTDINGYTTPELLSVAMLIVISTFALDFIHYDRSTYKVVGLDEAWTFLQVAQGKALSNKLIRAGRAMNAGVYFITQNTDDLAGEKIKNNIGIKFAFRSTDIDEIKKILKFFGLDTEDENSQKMIRELPNGCCLMQDIYGRVGVVKIDLVFRDLFNAFDSRPPEEKEEEEPGEDAEPDEYEEPEENGAFAEYEKQGEGYADN